MDWGSFLRQLYLCTGIWTVNFLEGLYLGMLTVMVPQLRRANQTISDDDASWLVAAYSYSGTPWIFAHSVLITAIGPKKTQMISCSSIFIAFIIFYFSTNINQLYIGNIFVGAQCAAVYVINMSVLTEYTSSKYRGVFLPVKSATFFWGILVSNTIGTYFHFQNIIILGLVCSAYTILNVVIWPESPLWLATKGKIVECSTAHRWLKGNDEASEKELDELLRSQEQVQFVKQRWSVRYIILFLKRKQYLKPLMFSTLLILLYCFSGKLICTVYAIDLLKKISNSESTAYTGMLILDGVTVVSMYLGCILSRFLRRRVMIIGFSIVAIIIMMIISIYLYLASLSIVEESKYFSISLLATYSIAVSFGPMIMSTTILGELMPLESRILSFCLMALVFKVIYGTLSKVSLLCFTNLGIHGTFLLFAILSTVFLVIVYIFVPETKDKTIFEIDDFLKGEKRKVAEENNQLMNINNK